MEGKNFSSRAKEVWKKKHSVKLSPPSVVSIGPTWRWCKQADKQRKVETDLANGFIHGWRSRFLALFLAKTKIAGCWLVLDCCATAPYYHESKAGLEMKLFDTVAYVGRKVFWLFYRSNLMWYFESFPHRKLLIASSIDLCKLKCESENENDIFGSKWLCFNYYVSTVIELRLGAMVMILMVVSILPFSEVT